MEGNSRESTVGPELFFLISKFLSLSPLEETKRVLIRELERHKILPKRIDWLGQEHDQTFEELERKYPHIGPKHLLEICSRIGPILDREMRPSVTNVQSLLGAGRQSLLRSKETIITHRRLVDFCTRLKGAPLPESIVVRKENNLSRVLFGREHGGPIIRRLAVSSCLYEKQSLLRRTLGHLSAVYCVLFDRSGKYILTGADDFLVKLWSTTDGRLLATFRGASSEITDIAVNIDNTLMAAGSLDRILRVWDLQTTAPIAVLTSHTGMITSVNFCPSPRGDLRYLVTTSTDGSVAFWQYAVQRGKTQFNSRPIQYHEKLRPGQAQMICAAFSPGGIFLAAGSADHFVRVYLMGNDGPKRILETEAHTDTVDSIQWAHQGLRFISGGKDGTAHIWHFESQQWRSMRLSMNARLPGSDASEDDGKKLKVTMVSWDASDNWVMTAVNDFTIKVWNSKTGQLHKVLKGHTDELYVLESHPKDQHVLLSAGHDGQIYLWDIYTGKTINSFVNYIEGQGNGGVFDAKWSPDGTMIGATDSHGHILMFGFGSGHERMKKLPTELFFHTDYRPVIRDADHHVLDEQTQMLPHLMPPPFLVDVDGNPHPPALQRLVPGRENCPTDQLIPNIGPGNEGVEDMRSENNRVSDLDLLIEALAQRQGNGREAAAAAIAAQNRNNNDPRPANNPGMRGNPNDNAANNQQPAQPNVQRPPVNLNSPRGSQNRVGLRRSGDVEGVRQSSGNWHRDASFKFQSRCFVKPIRAPRLMTLKFTVYSIGHQEMEIYKREMRRRPLMINTNNNQGSPGGGGAGAALGRTRRGRQQAPPPSNSNYRTRSVRVMDAIQSEEEEEEDDNAESNSSGSSSDMSEEMAALDGSSSSDSESEYSDWVADQPGPNLEPPKRSTRVRCERRAYSPSGGQLPGPSSSRRSEPDAATRQLLQNVTEVPAEMRPSEWLTEVVPRKAPYYPQMGDEVVYLRQGHNRYLEAVRAKHVYELSDNAEPWEKITLRDHEFVKVIGIKYELKPPRLCCLKLALMDVQGNMTGRSFTIKYHDMPDVLDFLVLRQTYDMAVSRRWKPGDRFRCMIDDGWWMGAIETRTALSSEFPQSLFMCFHVRWDNGEFEYMSPWDMEPVDENRLPTELGGAVPVLPAELQALLYQPKPEEWLDEDRESACRRICAGLERIMMLPFTSPFLAPVDLDLYPSYAYMIAYPIDLATIKLRFENHFYRRITSAQFDVRFLARNAEIYNVPRCEIVEHARVLTELCLWVMREPDIDVDAASNQLFHSFQWSDNEQPQGEPSSSRAGTSRRTEATGSRRSQRGAPMDWKRECLSLLEMLWQCDDSSPFREPVDVIEHPDYHQVIDTPMDLLTIKEDLLGGNYTSPLDFAKDARLIFQNSKNYNTNKRSRIYSMTLRLSTLFETHMGPILTNWKKPKRSRNRHSGDRNEAVVVDPQEPGTSQTRRSRRAVISNGVVGRGLSSSDDDDSGPIATTSASSRRGSRVSAAAAAAGTASSTSTSQGNAVSSSSMAGPSTSYSRQRTRSDLQDGPSSSSSRPTRSSRTVLENGSSQNATNGRVEPQGRFTRRRAEGNRVVDEEEGVDDDQESGDSSESSSGSEDSDGSNEIPLSELGNAKRGNRQYDDSEDSYRPRGSSTRRASKRKKKKKNKSRPAKTQVVSQSSQSASQSSRRATRRGQLPLSEDDADTQRFQRAHRDNGTDEDTESDHSAGDDEVLRPSKRNRTRPQTNMLRSPSGEPEAATSSRRENPRRGAGVRNGTRRRLDSESEDRQSDDALSRRPKKRTRYESDQSFQLEEPRSTRRAPRGGGGGLESGDEESAAARATRSSRRRSAWTNGNHQDDDEQEEEEIEAEEPTRGSRRIANSAPSQRSNNRRTRVNEEEEDDDVGQGRFRTRHRALFDEVEEEEDDEDDDENSDGEEEEDDDSDSDRPRRTSRNRGARNNLINRNRHSLRTTRSGRLNNHDTDVVGGSGGSRDYEGPATTVVPSSVSAMNERSSRRRFLNGEASRAGVELLAPHEVDHNYLQPDHQVRSSRRALSRHQRNADEWDPLQEPSTSAHHSVLAGVVASTSRQRATTQSTTTTDTIVQRRSYITRAPTTSSPPSRRGDVVGESTEVANGLSRLRPSHSRVGEPGPSSSHGIDSASQRSSGRKVRRMDYNEDSGREEGDGEATRRCRAVTRRLAELDDANEEDGDEQREEEEDEPTVSVSSRGRVRKIIAKARRIFRE